MIYLTDDEKLVNLTHLGIVKAYIDKMENRIHTLEMANESEVSTNPFVITFANLDGLAVEDGVWNDTQVRMEY